jgi:hypothetical protein
MEGGQDVGLGSGAREGGQGSNGGWAGFKWRFLGGSSPGLQSDS